MFSTLYVSNIDMYIKFQGQTNFLTLICIMYEFYIDEFFRILDDNILNIMIYMLRNNNHSYSNTSKVFVISKYRIVKIKY